MKTEPSAQPSVASLHSEIMGFPVELPNMDGRIYTFASAYKHGHEDARYKAAEFAAAHEAELRAAVESKARDAQDAARYRWLREQCQSGAEGSLTIAKSGGYYLEGWSGDDPDKHIDAAIAALQPSEESK